MGKSLHKAVWENRYKTSIRSLVLTEICSISQSSLSLYFLSLWKKWKFQNVQRIREQELRLTERGPWPTAGYLRVWGLTNTPPPFILRINASLFKIFPQWTAICANLPCVQHPSLAPLPSASLAISITATAFVLIEPFKITNLWVRPTNYLRIGKTKPLWRGSHSTCSLSIFRSKGQTLSLSIACVYLAK